MNQGWWLKHQFKMYIYQHMTTCAGALWGNIICFLKKNGILSPEMASENRPNGKSKNLCNFNAQQNQGGGVNMLFLWIVL